jgi:hypothetical protein
MEVFFLLLLPCAYCLLNQFVRPAPARSAELSRRLLGLGWQAKREEHGA